METLGQVVPSEKKCVCLAVLARLDKLFTEVRACSGRLNKAALLL